MDATLNIIVRVAARQAQQQLNATAAAVRGVNAAASTTAATKGLSQYLAALQATGKAQANFANNLANSKLINHGKNLNWVGRQLIYNFTLPLALAGAALFKFNMDVQRSMTEVRKVYGDLSFSETRVKKETDLLARSFELLSTRFGVHQVEVVNIAAAWASAGSAGRGLAENVKATMEAMILGEMEAVEATEALIAIQATWQLSTYDSAGGVSELTQALAIMNVVENETAIRMSGLVDVFVRAGGAARTAGVTIAELAALAAVLVPATGSAAQAGNSLKTIISRLQAPTQQTIDLLEEIGFTVADPDWLGKTATQKLEALAGQWDGLSTAQRTYASSVLASRWQVNRFDVLLNDMASSTGMYAKALDVATRSSEELAGIYRDELTAVLESNPRKWDIMTNAIRNSMAKAFIPLIPAIMSVVGMIAQLAQAFSNLDPDIQRIILFGLVVTALVGPLLSLSGSLMQLIGTFKVFGKMLKGLGQLFWWFAVSQVTPALKYIAFHAIKLMAPVAQMFIVTIPAALGISAAAFGWIVLAIAAAAAAIALIVTTDIEEPILDALQNVVRWLGELPQVFANVFTGVINVLQRAIGVVVDLLSYLNPFQRHSPSLVDNVKAGISVILSEYEKLKTIPATVARALGSLSAFQQTASVDVTGFRSAELDKMVSDVGAYNPAAGNAAADMADDIMALESLLPVLSAEISRQRIEVAKLTFAYDQAAAAVESAEDALQAITDEMSAVADQIAGAQSKLDQLANTKINGMTAMEDAIFANSMAQKQLNLELLKFEQAGYTIESIQDKMAALAGEIEMLRGEQETLRMAGAGSDILSFYDDQIAALEAQRGPLNDIADQIQDIEDQLSKLDIEGQILELTQSITFDPLLREIDKLVEGVNEMSFEDIMAGISEQQVIIADLEAAYLQLQAAEKAAQETVDSTTAARDALGAQLDVEKSKLDALEQAYSDIESLISEMENSMASYVDAAKAAAEIDAAKKAADEQSLFEAAEGVNYDVAGGDSILGAEGDAFDIEEFNREMEKSIQDALEQMGNIDIAGVWGNLKEKIITWFNSIVEWVKNNWVRILAAAVIGAVAIAFGVPALLAIALGALGALFIALAQPIWDWTYQYIISPIVNAFASIGTWLGENVVEPIAGFLGTLGAALTVVWDSIIFPVLEGMWSTFLVLEGIIVGVWRAIWGVIEWAWGLIFGVFRAIYNFIIEYIIPGFQLFLVTGLIVWELITLAIQAAWGIISWVFERIWGALQALGGQFRWLWDRVWEIFTWIGEQANWLWHNAIEPAFNGIFGFISGVWDQLVGVFETFGEILAPIGEALRALYNGPVRTVMGAIGWLFASVWNGVISATATAINFFIMAFNAIARGVNAVAGLLGIDTVISTMNHVEFDALKFDEGAFGRSDAMVNGSSRGEGGPGATRYMASGGVLGRMGGAVKEARAIVGEGSNIHPEYVIPTDPRYRNRAEGLYRELGHTFGMDKDGYSNMDLFGDIGGAISSGFNAAKNGVGAVAGFVKDKALWAAWQPLKAAAEFALDKIPLGFIEDVGRGVLGAVDGWVTGADSAWNEEAAARRMVPATIAGAGSWKVIPQLLSRLNIPYKVLSTFRPGATTRFTGAQSWHALDRAIDLSGPSGMINYSHKDMLAINHAIYDAYKPQLKELIYGGPGAKNVLRGQDHRFSSSLLGEHVNHVHAALARGGFVVPRVPGGALFRIGEGLHDEAVQVTPLRGGSDDGGTTTINFYGDLSFPNITDPNDAERLLANLEALAGVKS